MPSTALPVQNGWIATAEILKTWNGPRYAELLGMLTNARWAGYRRNTKDSGNVTEDHRDYVVLPRSRSGLTPAGAGRDGAPYNLALLHYEQARMPALLDERHPGRISRIK